MGKTVIDHCKTIYRAALFLALAMYGVSLFLPGIIYQYDPSLDVNVGHPVPTVDYGFEILKWGWLALLAGNFAWCANPISIIAFLTVCFSGWDRPLLVEWVLTLFAFLVSLDAFAFSQKWLDEGGVNIAHVDHLGSGFYVWAGAFLLLVVAVFAKLFGVRGHSTPNPAKDAATRST